MDSFLLKAQQVEHGIKKLRKNTRRVREILARILYSPHSDDENQKLDQSMAEVKRKAYRIHENLKEIRAEADEDAKEKPASALSQLKYKEQQFLHKLFVDTMRAYNDAQMEYRDDFRNRIKRQLEVAGKSPTDDELEDLLKPGNFDVLSQGVAMESEGNRQAFADVRARRQNFLKLGESVREVEDFIIEIAVLDATQEAMINQMEQNIQNAPEPSKEARLLARMEDMAREARRAATETARSREEGMLRRLNEITEYMLEAFVEAEERLKACEDSLKCLGLLAECRFMGIETITTKAILKLAARRLSLAMGGFEGHPNDQVFGELYDARARELEDLRRRAKMVWKNFEKRTSSDILVLSFEDVKSSITKAKDLSHQKAQTARSPSDSFEQFKKASKELLACQKRFCTIKERLKCIEQCPELVTLADLMHKAREKAEYFKTRVDAPPSGE